MKKHKNDSVWEFLQREYNFCWENQKINYDTREKLLRIYIAVFSTLPASLIIFFNSDKESKNIYIILIVALFIIFIFSFLTWIRYLSLRKSIIRYRKYMNFIKKRLLEKTYLEPGEIDNILGEIPYTKNETLKIIEPKSGDFWLVVTIQIITSLALGIFIGILAYNYSMNSLISFLLYIFNMYSFSFIVFLISFIVFLLSFIFLSFIWSLYYSKDEIE